MKAVYIVTAALAFTAVTQGAADKPAAKPGDAPVVAAKRQVAEIKDVSPDEAEKLIKEKKGVVVLDVRTPDEFTEGHIAGAKNVDFQDDKFLDQLAGLDKNATYVLHCAAGGRSARALQKMKQLDFKSVYHMNGGMRAWTEAGKPVTK